MGAFASGSLTRLLVEASVLTGQSWNEMLDLPDGVLETYVDVMAQRKG